MRERGGSSVEDGVRNGVTVSLLGCKAFLQCRNHSHRPFQYFLLFSFSLLPEYRMGSNIGIRLIDEYLSKTAYHSSSTDPSPPPTSSNSSSTNFNNGVCRSLNETAECIAKVGFKMFLGINVDVANFVDGPSGPEGTTFSLYIYQNPLAIFVELPSEGFDDLSYSEILCGVLEGSLSQVGLLVKCDMVRDVLKGDEVNEIRVYVRGRVKDDVGEGFKEE